MISPFKNLPVNIPFLDIKKWEQSEREGGEITFLRTFIATLGRGMGPWSLTTSRRDLAAETRKMKKYLASSPSTTRISQATSLLVTKLVWFRGWISGEWNGRYQHTILHLLKRRLVEDSQYLLALYPSRPFWVIICWVVVWMVLERLYVGSLEVSKRKWWMWRRFERGWSVRKGRRLNIRSRLKLRRSRQIGISRQGEMDLCYLQSCIEI